MDSERMEDVLKMIRKLAQVGNRSKSREEGAIDLTPEQRDAGKTIDLMADGDAESVLAFTMSLKAHEHRSVLYDSIPDMPLQEVCMHEDYYHYTPHDTSALHEVDLSRFPEYAIFKQEREELRAMRAVLGLAIDALEKRREILGNKLDAVENFVLPTGHEAVVWKRKTGKLYSLPIQNS